MTDTIGTLRLKIARLKYQLEVGRQQIALCSNHPCHRKKLETIQLRIQLQLDSLIKQQHHLVSETVVQNRTHRPA